MIVAAALFSISLLVLLGIFPLAARAVRKAEVRTIATHLAESQLERTRSTSFVSVADVPAYPVSVDIVNNNNTERVDFSVTQSVTPVASGHKHVRVAVQWKREDQVQTAYLETDVASTLP